MATIVRRSKKPVYKPVVKQPQLPYEQFLALKDNIAINGVLVPILVDSDGPTRYIIDGNYRKRIADELGYDCPEIVHRGLEELEQRTLARALNLARRQLSHEQRRALVADQLEEMVGRSNRWIAKQLGVHHATIASVRAELQSTGQIIQLDKTVGIDGRERSSTRTQTAIPRSKAEGRRRIEATTLIHGDATKRITTIATGSIDCIISDPPYPEMNKPYGKMSEKDWHEMMRTIVVESRRVLTPKGSAVFILQPNSKRFGEMRTWLFEFVVWAAKEWNLVQDVWWWSVDAMPLGGIARNIGLMRPSVKMCVWLGPSNCYRNQDNVLWTPSERNAARHRADIALRTGPSGRTYRNSTIGKAADERGGTTPMNCLPISTGGGPYGGEHHPAVTPYNVAAWWCRYILPPDGVLLDPFCGSGTMLVAGLDQGAAKVIGIEKEKQYLEIVKRRVRGVS